MTELRLDYSVECEECGQVEHASVDANETQARKDFQESGWKMVNNSNLCPVCVEDVQEGGE